MPSAAVLDGKVCATLRKSRRWFVAGPAISRYAVAVCPPLSSDCSTCLTSPVVLVVGGGLPVYPDGGVWLAARGLIAGSGWKTQRTRSPPLGVTAATSTWLWMKTWSDSCPALVVIVPVSSAFHRPSRQLTDEIVPAGSSVRCPTGRRARPNKAPNSGRWSCTSECWTVNRTWFCPGSLYTSVPSRPSPRNGPSCQTVGSRRHSRSCPRRKSDHCVSVVIWLSSGTAAMPGSPAAAPAELETAAIAAGNAAAAAPPAATPRTVRRETPEAPSPSPSMTPPLRQGYIRPILRHETSDGYEYGETSSALRQNRSVSYLAGDASASGVDLEMLVVLGRGPVATPPEPLGREGLRDHVTADDHSGPYVAPVQVGCTGWRQHQAHQPQVGQRDRASGPPGDAGHLGGHRRRDGGDRALELFGWRAPDRPTGRRARGTRLRRRRPLLADPLCRLATGGHP